MKPSHACGATQDGRVMVERSDGMWSTGEGNGKPLQYSCLENPMNRGTWWATVNGVAKSQTRLSDFTFTFASLVAQRVKHLPTMRETWVQSLGGEDPLEKGKATHSSILTWTIPWTV